MGFWQGEQDLSCHSLLWVRNSLLLLQSLIPALVARGPDGTSAGTLAVFVALTTKETSGCAATACYCFRARYILAIYCYSGVSMQGVGNGILLVFPCTQTFYISLFRASSCSETFALPKHKRILRVPSCAHTAGAANTAATTATEPSTTLRRGAGSEL